MKLGKKTTAIINGHSDAVILDKSEYGVGAIYNSLAEVVAILAECGIDGDGVESDCIQLSDLADELDNCRDAARWINGLIGDYSWMIDLKTSVTSDLEN